MLRTMFPTVLLTGLLLCGCINTQSGQAAGTMASVHTVRSGTMCGGRAPSPQLSWIDSDRQLKKLWKGFYRNRLGGATDSVPTIDWNTYSLILIRMGQKTSGGYGIKLAQPAAQVKSDVAFVQVQWIAPPANAIVTQVITSPCLLVKIKKGAYRSVVILDQSGLERARADLSQ